MNPLVIWPKEWKSRVILNDTANDTAVHHHGGTYIDGAYPVAITTEYQVENQAISNNTPGGMPGLNHFNYDDSSIKRLPPGNPTGHYGFKGNLIKKPRMIRLIHNAGWYGNESYPSNIFTELSGGLDYHDLQSVYLPRQLVPIIFGGFQFGQREDYLQYDNITGLLQYCKDNDIMLSWMSHNEYTAFNEPTFHGPTEHGPHGINLSEHRELWDERNTFPFGRGGHPGRWINHLSPYFPYGNISFGGFFSGSHQLLFNGITDWDPATQVVGGDLLNIIFVTDGFSAYHGVSFDDYGEAIWGNQYHGDNFPYGPWVTGSQECMSNDILRCRNTMERFHHYGNLVVHSPKNAHFFPIYMNNFDEGVNFGIGYCLTEAQRHLDQASDQLPNSTFLIRRYSRRTTVETDIHQDVPFQLEWAQPPITFEAIMSEIQNFFQ